MKTLILVDIQNDFVGEGALAVVGGDEVVPVANRLMARGGCFDLVVATQDWHPGGHESCASRHVGKSPGDIVDLYGVEQVLWPDHCVQGTVGAEFVSTLDVDRIGQVFRKGTNSRVDSYSGFYDNDHKSATGLGDYLRERGVTEVTIVGLATDYCVKFTALDARGLGFETSIILEGVRGVELAPGDTQRALDVVTAAGVTLE